MEVPNTVEAIVGMVVETPNVGVRLDLPKAVRVDSIHLGFSVGGHVLVAQAVISIEL